jgi:hypothetical protein
MRRRNASAAIRLALWFLGIASFLVASDEPTNSLEISKVDLFSSRQWTSLDISVGGFKLGMTKEDVSRLAEQKGYKILDTLGRNQECEQKRCDVYSRGSRPLGVSLVYGDDAKLREIEIDSIQMYSESGEPDWAKDVIALKLHGDTDQLVNHFSEELCHKLLGNETRKEQDGNSRVSTASAIYENRGIAIHYMIDLRGKQRTFFDIELSLIQPEP